MENPKNGPGKRLPLLARMKQGMTLPKRKLYLVVSASASLVLIIMVVGYFRTSWQQPAVPAGQDQGQPAGDNGGQNSTVVLASNFANWEDVPVSFQPQVPAYTVDKDLGNVTNAGDFTFSDQAKALLSKNAFVVTPSDGQEFYPLYESNRYAMTPSFITTDSMLHSYHLMFDDMLKKLEEEKLSAELKTLNASMLSQSLGQYTALRGTEWENAARRNVAYFAVGGKLLDGSVTVPAAVKGEVEKELSLIEAHAGVDNSAVMNIGVDAATAQLVQEDYSQYVPRGHYTKSDNLKAYFKAMMWYGRMSFRLKNEDEVKSSLLITLLLSDKENQERWDRIYEPINFFVGKSDDITYYQYRDVMKQAYGDNVSLDTLKSGDAQLKNFIALAQKLEAPQVYSIPIPQASMAPDREAETKAFRFLGQRFTVDASIFQNLMYRQVGDKTTSCAKFDATKTGCLSGARCLPKGLDIPAAMGSSEAYGILKNWGETDYACYDDNLSKAKAYLSGLEQDVWTQNLYWGWLYALKPLTEEKAAGYPSFMTNAAWQRKDLNTYLGSWTELKRDTILYAKQAYAELGGGGDERDDRGYVEPEPYVYARLASLLKMTKSGLDQRGLLSEEDKTNFDNLTTMAVELKTISEKELNNAALSNDDYDFIRDYGGNIEHIWYSVFGKDGAPELDENTNAPVVADVATDPNGSALEEGTGYVSEIYAVVPVDGKLRIARGAVYSYYEFSQPIAQRLSDESWKEMLKNGTAPALPDWTQAFTSK